MSLEKKEIENIKTRIENLFQNQAGIEAQINELYKIISKHIVHNKEDKKSDRNTGTTEEAPV